MNAGFSGHGFMHSPAAGLLAAEEIMTGRTPTLDISMLRLDRYKKGKALSEAIRIMSFMKKEQHIDPELFDLFLRSGVYREYAEQHMRPEQAPQRRATRVP